MMFFLLKKIETKKIQKDWPVLVAQSEFSFTAVVTLSQSPWHLQTLRW